jgi:hypothetical protein
VGRVGLGLCKGRHVVGQLGRKKKDSTVRLAGTCFPRLQCISSLHRCKMCMRCSLATLTLLRLLCSRPAATPRLSLGLSRLTLLASPSTLRFPLSLPHDSHFPSNRKRFAPRRAPILTPEGLRRAHIVSADVRVKNVEDPCSTRCWQPLANPPSVWAASVVGRVLCIISMYPGYFSYVFLSHFDPDVRSHSMPFYFALDSYHRASPLRSSPSSPTGSTSRALQQISKFPAF